MPALAAAAGSAMCMRILNPFATTAVPIPRHRNVRGSFGPTPSRGEGRTSLSPRLPHLGVFLFCHTWQGGAFCPTIHPRPFFYARPKASLAPPSLLWLLVFSPKKAALLARFQHTFRANAKRHASASCYLSPCHAIATKTPECGHVDAT